MGKQEILTNLNKPYKWRLAELFAFWLSAPMLLELTEDQSFKKKLVALGNELLGMDIREILAIGTQKEFGSKFGITEQTLVAWKNSEYVKSLVSEFRKNKDIEQFQKEVDFAFTIHTIRHPTVANVSLWKKLYKGL